MCVSSYNSYHTIYIEKYCSLPSSRLQVQVCEGGGSGNLQGRRTLATSRKSFTEFTKKRPEINGRIGIIILAKKREECRDKGIRQWNLIYFYPRTIMFIILPLVTGKCLGKKIVIG